MKLSTRIFIYFTAAFCIVLAGYFSVIESDIANNLNASQHIKIFQNNIQYEYNLRKNIKQVNQQLDWIKKQYPVLYSYQSHKPSFSDCFKLLIKVMNESNIQLIRLQPSPKNNNTCVVEISMIGAFQNLLNMIDRFQKFLIPVFIHSIRIQSSSPLKIDLSLEMHYV